MSDGKVWDAQSRRLFALLGQANVKDKADRLKLYRWFFQDNTIASTNDLSADALRSLADTLSYWQREGRLESEARSHITD